MNFKTIALAVFLLGASSVHAEEMTGVEDASSVTPTSVVPETKSTVVKKKKARHHKKRHHQSRHHAHPAVAIPVSADASLNSQSQSYGDLVQKNPDMVRNEYRTPGESHVSTGPYVGIPLQYSGSNLIINSPSVNTDTQLLSVRKKLTQNAIGAATGSHLLLSGVVEGQLAYNKKGAGNNTASIDLTSVYLDAVILGPSDWVTGFIEFGYDNGGGGNEYAQYKVNNSRVLVNKAFLTFGNFNDSPFYMSLGQYYVPYGAYSSIVITDPLTKSVGRTKGRALTVGFAQQEDNAFYGAVYAFPGFSTSGNQNRINNGGVNVGYKFVGADFQGNIGVGMIRNIADSVGLQTSGFSTTAVSQQLVHAVPGYNVHGSLSFGEHIDLIAEYIGASKKFDPSNLSFNGVGARPWAMDLLGAYSFTAFGDKPSSFGLSYARSGQAVGMGMEFPKHRYSAVFNTSLYRNTLQSLEFRHDKHYSVNDTANIAGGSAITGAGKSDNAITAQFDYFF